MRVLKASAIALVLVSVTALPSFSKALTYQEIIDGQQPDNHQGQVLGAVTPSPDVNGDGIVNSLDFAVLKGHRGENYAKADLNNDGVVNSLDFSILSSWYFAKK